MKEYEAILQAMDILQRARVDVSSHGATPHWTLLFHAWQHLNKQANAILRGE